MGATPVKDDRKLVGNRFEGSYSINRKLADINDRKQRGSLRLLTWEDMDDLRSRMAQIIQGYQLMPEKLKPYDLKYPQKSSKILGLNYEDTVELRDLAGKLTELLLPS